MGRERWQPRGKCVPRCMEMSFEHDARTRMTHTIGRKALEQLIIFNDNNSFGINYDNLLLFPSLSMFDSAFVLFLLYIFTPARHSCWSFLCSEHDIYTRQKSIKCVQFAFCLHIARRARARSRQNANTIYSTIMNWLIEAARWFYSYAYYNRVWVSSAGVSSRTINLE